MSKIIVALDGVSEDRALDLAKSLSGNVWGFKVNDLIVEYGVSIVKKLKAYGNVFADPKLHDIPNTVANSVKRFAEVGADLITVHASAGRAALKAAADSRGNSSVLAITALTSLSEHDTKEIYTLSPQAVVEKFARLASESGLQGVVCSPQELKFLSNYLLLKVTPGVRLQKTQDDQTRVATPKEAIDAGASLLVIGRPITESKDPLETVKEINKQVL